MRHEFFGVKTLFKGSWLRAVLGLAVLVGLVDVGAADNLVRLENQKTGTTNWILSRVEPSMALGRESEYKRRKAVEAYASRTSIKAGEVLEVFVSTDPASPYRVDVYRLGYYGGKGGTRMATLGPFKGKAEPVPEDGPNRLVRCSWDKGFSMPIPETWVSGVYLGKLTTLPGGFQSYFIFIVRDDRKADVIFQCSDLTWQAYNRWPGKRSLYDWKDNSWHTGVGADVGFDRPYMAYYNPLPSDFNPLTIGSGEFLLWEFPLAYWLEEQGYDVTYISNLDTHKDGAGLLRSKAFLSVGHDEYWTPEMYDHVAKARDAGVHLAFLSGNSVFGKIYLNPSSSGTSHRVMGRVEAFSNEQDLMGATSYGVGFADWKCVAPDHWVYAGTGMKYGNTIPNLVGWEFQGLPLREDKSLVVLAQSEVDRGKRVHAGTLYTAESGSLVFNAGTCWWNLLLSTPPGFQNPAHQDFTRNNVQVQRMTRNLLDRMLGR